MSVSIPLSHGWIRGFELPAKVVETSAYFDRDSTGRVTLDFPVVAVSHWAAVMRVTVHVMFAHDSTNGSRSKPRSMRQAVSSLGF